MDEGEILAALETAIAEINNNLSEAAKLLERTVFEIVQNNPNNIAAVRFAIENFERNIPRELAPLRTLASSIIEQFDEPFEGADQLLIDQVYNSAAQNISSAVGATTGAVLALIFAGLAIGESPTTIANRSAAKISGVFVETTDPLARRAQSRLRKLYASDAATRESIQAAVAVIRKQLVSMDLTADLTSALRGKVSDVVYDFHGAFVLARATRLGYTKFQYKGSVARNSRDFCITHLNKTYTQAEIRKVWQGNWAGKRPGNPMVVRGGYNCRHFWVPVR